MMRCSRAMSCAEARRSPSGGRRSAQRLPAASATPYVRLERPPEMRSKASGSSTPGTFCVNHASTPARSMPSGVASVACAAMAAKHMALMVDFGGVLTTSIWDSFAAFCEGEGLDPGTVRDLFRGDPRALATLRMLERGVLDDEEFERRFASQLRIERSEGLIDRLFAGLEPEERMLESVRHVRSSGAPTGLISNSWGTGIYERGRFEGLFDVTVISGEVGMHKPQPEIYLLACERLGVEPGDCLFVDDLRENCAGAEAVGMSALLHRDPDRTVAMLAELFAVEPA